MIISINWCYFYYVYDMALYWFKNDIRRHYHHSYNFIFFL